MWVLGIEPKSSTRTSCSFKMYLFMYVCECFVCMYSCTPEEGIESHRITVTDGCELPCWCWKLNPRPLEEQLMLLTAEPSLQPPVISSR